MLLSRVADNLFWMARYVERAECTARLLDVGRRMASLATDQAGASSEWASTVEASGCGASFAAGRGVPTAASVIEHLVRDTGNPSSIFASLAAVRRNARAVRTALSKDAWDAVNGTWIEAQAWGDEDFSLEGLPRILDWVRERSQRFGGAVANTMLRQDAYWWMRLGASLERAENVARIVDARWRALLPLASDADERLDRHEWGAVLGAVAASRAYYWVYRDRLEPSRVAELVILRPELPRSLLCCVGQAATYLGRIASGDGDFPPGAGSGRELPLNPGRPSTPLPPPLTPPPSRREGGEAAGAVGPSLLAVRALEASLRRTTIAEVYERGLHEFLVQFIATVNGISDDVRREYLLG